MFVVSVNLAHEDGECTRRHIDAAMERIRSDLRLLAEKQEVWLQRIDNLRIDPGRHRHGRSARQQLETLTRLIHRIGRSRVLD